MEGGCGKVWFMPSKETRRLGVFHILEKAFMTPGSLQFEYCEYVA